MAKSNENEAMNPSFGEKAMLLRAREMAVYLTCAGRAPLRRAKKKSLEEAIDEMRRDAPGDEQPSLEQTWFGENGRVALALLDRPSGAPLPASGGVPRVQHLMRALARGGDGLVTERRLVSCVRAFDEVRALTMDEIWQIPAALRAEMSFLYLDAAKEAVRNKRERARARKWASGEGDMPAAPSPAFLEHALRILNEQPLPEVREKLEARLGALEINAQSAVRAEYERQAVAKLRLEHATATLRMLDALDWTKCFEQVSRAEAALRSDPSGTYPRMDDESKAAVRDRLREIARATGLAETTVARQAAEAARGDAPEPEIDYGDKIVAFTGGVMTGDTASGGALPAGMTGAPGLLAAIEEEQSAPEDVSPGPTGEICWWLYTDEGVRALLARLGMRARVRRAVPDPTGRKTVAAITLLAVVLLIVFSLLGAPLWSLLCAIPVLWGAAGAVVLNVGARRKPRRTLKLRYENVPDDRRALVTLPVLLSSPEQARGAAAELIALSCLTDDSNIDFCLLGDLPAAKTPETDEDESIVRAADEVLRAWAARADRKNRCFFLRRAREQDADGVFTGRERKRGALESLNEYLCGGENVFLGVAPERNYRYVVCLDAGTRALPGEIERLIGAIAHPLNAGRALMQPRMTLSARATRAPLARLLGGAGGVDVYPVNGADAYMTLAGEGTFCGKGVYDVRAFRAALQGKIKPNTVLSHDMLEGAFAGCAQVGDVALCEPFPATVDAYFKRLHRWTRGDWQNLRYIPRVPGALSKYKMLDSLRASLESLSQIALLIGALVAGEPAIWLLFFLPFLLGLRADADAWKAQGLRLALLPLDALTRADAAVRALFRMTVSHRRMLEWRTAQDADARSGHIPKGCFFALGGLSALLSPWGIPFLALWASAPFWISKLEKTPPEDAPACDREVYLDVARRTWRYFERCVGETGIPCDNIQIEPNAGRISRTSPTNIGLYIAACPAAKALGLIGEDDMRARLTKAVAALETMDKWEGQLYNWYDADTLEPLRPRYVSSVDGGNLAACLLYAAAAIGDCPLAARLTAVARGMRFEALYNENRGLFRIGCDAEQNRPAESHYDLLASESRLLYYVALMLGRADATCWKKLGRATTRTEDGCALLSWSGTMFEYLMPDLFLDNVPGTLLRQSRDAVLDAQIDAGECYPFWGVSESGYFAFDESLQYQYRAFGLPELALRGDDTRGVVAPYAALLAAPFAPDLVRANMSKMRDAGMLSELGFFEAMDLSLDRLPADADRKIVKSHMTHHQGMILLSICNALCGGQVRKTFMNLPEARALSLLLEEKPARSTDMPRRTAPPLRATDEGEVRMARSLSCKSGAGSHLLFGGGSTLYATATGEGYCMHRGVLLNRRGYDPRRGGEGFFVHLRLPSGDTALLSGDPRLTKRVTLDAGSAETLTETDIFTARLLTLVSPEDGALCQHVTLANHTDAPARAEITACFAVALSPESAYLAHPAFQNLFVESRLAQENALAFRRVPRGHGETPPQLVYICAGGGEKTYETDLYKLAGRGEGLCAPGGVAEVLTQSLGSTLNPCAAWRTTCEIPAGGERTFAFTALLCEACDIARNAERYQDAEAVLRQRELAETQARAMLRFLGVDAKTHALLQASARALVYPEPRAAQAIPDEDRGARELWAMGLSGELPILLCEIRDEADMPFARDLLRAHAFYRAMGVWCDLVYVNAYGSGYEQPVRDALLALVASSHARSLVGKPGGARVLDANCLTESQLELLRLCAALPFDASGDPLPVQWKRALKPPRPAAPRELPPGEGVPKETPRFLPDGRYTFTCASDDPTPAPYVNILAGEQFGMLLSERGGGFLYQGNSRGGRLTPYDNDPLREGFHMNLYLEIDGARTCLYPMPGESRFRARLTYEPGVSVLEGACDACQWRVTAFVPTKARFACRIVELKTRSDAPMRLGAQVDWLMGAHPADARMTRVGMRGDLIWARGSADGPAFASMTDARARDPYTLEADLAGESGREARFVLMTGGARSEKAWRIETQSFDADKSLGDVRESWRKIRETREIATPDANLNAMLNVWLPCQTIMSRLRARTGFYQPGGAYGFRDQLQDMLALLDLDPATVRAHIVECCAHQFEDGDVQHWWHPERVGVRTRISDDMLFLPYVAAIYADETGDESIFTERARFLKNVEIPVGEEDWYGDAPLSEEVASVRAHCLRAIRRACRFGEHGLALMGAGDWNDGMNRVGAQGRGESVWLTEFLLVTLRLFAPYADEKTAEAPKTNERAPDPAVPSALDAAALSVDASALDPAALSAVMGAFDPAAIIAAPGAYDPTVFNATSNALHPAAPNAADGALNPDASNAAPGASDSTASGAADGILDLYASNAAPGAADGAASTPSEGERLRALADKLAAAIEEHGWDGEWYLRAYADDGRTLGGRESANGCQIDSISQSWAAAAGLSRANQAVSAADERLADADAIRLLAPPFAENSGVGYIASYPPGVRENGGQYTHAACWLAMAMARLGRANDAWRIVRALMPYAHADTEAKRARYRVEPYVIAGDVYALGPYAGRGGWTWYTGAAAWLIRVATRELLGFERKDGFARLNALLPDDWEEVSVTVRAGKSEYRLLARRNARADTLDGKPLPARGVKLLDDGRKHTAVFRPRAEKQD